MEISDDRSDIDISEKYARKIRSKNVYPGVKNDGGTIGSGQSVSEPHVAIIGGGITGLFAAKDLTERGIHVTLIEKTPQIGGNYIKLNKIFPTDECSA